MVLKRMDVELGKGWGLIFKRNILTPNSIKKII